MPPTFTTTAIITAISARMPYAPVPDVTFAAMDANLAALCVLGGLTGVGMWLFFVEGALMGNRHKVYPQSMWMTACWIAHDGHYTLLFHKWFFEQDHWFPKFLWVGILVPCLVECYYLFQTIRFGRAELSPGYSQTGHAVRMLGTVAGACLVWAAMKQALDDEYFLVSSILMQVNGPIAAYTILSSRPDGRGQSVVQWIGWDVMAICYGIASVFFMGGGVFHSWQYVGLIVTSTIWSLAYTYDVYHSGALWSSRTPDAEPKPANGGQSERSRLLQ